MQFDITAAKHGTGVIGGIDVHGVRDTRTAWIIDREKNRFEFSSNDVAQAHGNLGLRSEFSMISPSRSTAKA